MRDVSFSKGRLLSDCETASQWLLKGAERELQMDRKSD